MSSPNVPDDKSEIWGGICVEVANIGFIAVTVESIGLQLEKKEVVFFPGELPNGEKFPKRLEPRTSLNYYITSLSPQTVFRDGLPSAKYFFAKTSCGVTVVGNSKVTKWLIKIGKQTKVK